MQGTAHRATKGAFPDSAPSARAPRWKFPWATADVSPKEAAPSRHGRGRCQHDDLAPQYRALSALRLGQARGLVGLGCAGKETSPTRQISGTSNPVDSGTYPSKCSVKGGASRGPVASTGNCARVGTSEVRASRRTSGTVGRYDDPRKKRRWSRGGPRPGPHRAGSVEWRRGQSEGRGDHTGPPVWRRRLDRVSVRAGGSQPWLYKGAKHRPTHSLRFFSLP